MADNALRSLWAEPRVPDPPRRVWRDWVLVAVVVPVAVLEGSFRSDLAWRPVSLTLCLGLVGTLLWRRTHPLVMVVLAFGAFAGVDVAAILGGAEGLVGLYTNAFVLVLPYALFRWGAGRELPIGLAFMLLAGGVGILGEYTSLPDALGGMIVLLFPAVLGAGVRYQSSSRVRELDQVRLREREQLARELHDTVAHHVSAIAVQAQAARTVAADRPAAAADALAVIEEAASRTLVEMRSIVRALRADEEPEREPQPRVADIERLARDVHGDLRVDVQLSGDLDDINASVETALYRLSQEAITNATRHARHATRVDIRVTGDRGCVRLTVDDDGATVPAGADPLAGYGLVGMTERAALLGGTLRAGPGPGRGWGISAVLPKTGAAR